MSSIQTIKVLVPGPPGSPGIPGPPGAPAVSVSNYGAVGDDATDNTNAFQDAFDAIDGVGGGVIHVPQGTYRTGVLLIPNNTTLQGTNSGASILKPLASIPEEEGYIRAKVSPNAVGPERTAYDIAIRNLGFDGSLRSWPVWLSKLDGTPITDPWTDYYAPTGALASGITPPSLTAVLTGDAVTSIIVNSGGAGFKSGTPVYIPNTVLLEFTGGGGTDASGFGTIVDGAITSCTIQTGGRNYTSPPTVRTMGGYRSIEHLVSIDRRNPNYQGTAALIGFAKVDRALVENCYFTNYSNMVISDSGCRSFRIINNTFYACGRADGPFHGVWASSYGSVAAPLVWFSDCEDSQVIGNTFRDLRRGAALWNPSKGGVWIDNYVDGVRETGIATAPPANGGSIVFRGGYIKNVVCADIVANGIEVAPPTGDWPISSILIDGVYFENTGGAISASGVCNLKVVNNTFKNCFNHTAYGWGPFSERYTYSVGTQPVAGSAFSIEEDGSYFGIGSKGTDTGDPQLYANNTIIETGEIYGSIFKQTKSGSNSIARGVVIQDNLLEVPDDMRFLNDDVGLVWAPGQEPIIRNNKGHQTGKGLSLIPPITVSSVYLTPPFWGATSTVTLTANTLYLVPIWIPFRRAFVSAAINCTIGAAPGAVRIGLYNSAWNALPGELLVEPTATTQFDCTTTGTKTSVSSYSLMMEEGLYWLGLVSNGTPTLTAIDAGNQCGARFTGGAITPIRGVSVASTYGALVDLSLTVAGTTLVTTQIPIVGIR